MPKYYIAIINQPGYLLDNDPAEFYELSDAESYLIDELDQEIENVYQSLDNDFVTRYQAARDLLEIRKAKQDVRKFGIAAYGKFSYEIQAQIED